MLKEIRIQFESDIRSDFETMPNLVQMETERVALRAAICFKLRQKEEIETKIRCLRAERERMITALNEIQSKAVYIANRALDTRRQWENLSL